MLQEFQIVCEHLVELLRQGNEREARSEFLAVYHRFNQWVSTPDSAGYVFLPFWIELDEMFNNVHARQSDVASIGGVMGYWETEFPLAAEMVRKRTGSA